MAGHIFALSEPPLGNPVEGCMMNEEPLIGPIVHLRFFFILFLHPPFSMQNILLAVQSWCVIHVPRQNRTMRFYSLTCWADGSLLECPICHQLPKVVHIYSLKPKPWPSEIPYKEWQRQSYSSAFNSLFIPLLCTLLSLSPRFLRVMTCLASHQMTSDRHF